jgi:hypothetical protein
MPLIVTYIPKCMVEKIKNKHFFFIWIGKREKKWIPLLKWTNISKFKKAGRWGLKNIHSFGEGLTINFLWRLIKVDGLWYNYKVYGL